VLLKQFPELSRKELAVHVIVILGILGIACILLSSFRTPKKEEIPQETEFSVEDYRLQLQSQLEDMLHSISGVGSVQVLVTIGGSEQYHYAQEDEKLVTDQQVRTNNTYVTIGGSNKEALVESVSHPQITGVVVVCDGGSSNIVKESVYQAVSVACGIPTGCIYVTQAAQ
jgi:stage III sporulation protein AG